MGYFVPELLCPAVRLRAETVTGSRTEKRAARPAAPKMGVRILAQKQYGVVGMRIVARAIELNHNNAYPFRIILRWNGDPNDTGIESQRTS